MCQGKPPWNLQEAAQFINRVGAKNLHLAPSIGLLLAQKVNPADIAGLIREKVGLWLISTPAFDIGGHLWNINAPLTSGDWGAKIAEFISLAPNVPINLDTVYNNWDEVYQDMQVLGK
jgi:hypothetical protein